MSDLQQLLAEHLRTAITTAIGAAHANVDPLVRPSGNVKFGDYQANVAMSLGKTLGEKPRDVAQKIAAALQGDPAFEKIEVAGPGFINLTLSANFLADRARELADDPRSGVPVASQSDTVVVDYSAPNVAKEMHVGHLRSTIIGDSIARVMEFQGHRVVRQNHVGDWGTQFGMLIEHMLDEGGADAASHSVSDLNALYQAAKKKFDASPEFAERSRKRVVLLQAGDANTLTLWKALIAQSQRHFDEAYRRLGVSLTEQDIRGESFYNPMLAPVLADLEKAGILQESDGAQCVFPPGFAGEEGKALPLIVRKSDGGYLYATTDLAALRYRIGTLGARRLVYVTDARQKQHFAMVFAVARMAGWIPEGVRVEHVPFGAVLGEDGKPFKTRSGETVKLAELIDEAEERALAILAEKASTLDEEARKRTAHAVGIGAVKYADLSNDRVKDYVFSWPRMLSFDGNTAPYLQNAYVRIRSIFRKASLTAPPAGVTITVHEPAERALLLALLQFPSAVASVADSLEPHRLCGYLYGLAAAYHQFYEHCPVITAPTPALRDSRFALIDATARTLARGLELLGIEVIEQM